MCELAAAACASTRDEDRGHEVRPDAAGEAPRPEPRDDELEPGLDPRVWTRPLTKKEWEVACGLIMYWAMHGGC